MIYQHLNTSPKSRRIRVNPNPRFSFILSIPWRMPRRRGKEKPATSEPLLLLLPQILTPNPRKRNNLKYLVPSFYNCHSCDRHVPPRRQTLASLFPLVSEWRVVHLCDQCLCLIKSAVKCSYCFADFPAASSSAGNARAGSTSLPSSGLPRRRFSSPSLLCVLIAALCRCLGIRSLGDAKRAMGRAREALGADPVVLKKRDGELALKLHLAMNGSQRILRSGCSMSSNRFPLSNLSGYQSSYSLGLCCLENER